MQAIWESHMPSLQKFGWKLWILNYSNTPQLKGSFWYFDENVNKFLMGFYMQFTVSFELYIDVETRHIPYM